MSSIVSSVAKPGSHHLQSVARDRLHNSTSDVAGPADDISSTRRWGRRVLAAHPNLRVRRQLHIWERRQRSVGFVLGDDGKPRPHRRGQRESDVLHSRRGKDPLLSHLAEAPAANVSTTIPNAGLATETAIAAVAAIVIGVLIMISL